MREGPGGTSREQIEDLSDKETVTQDVLQQVLDVVPENIQAMQEPQRPFTDFETDEGIIRRGVVSWYLDHSYQPEDPIISKMKELSEDKLVLNMRE